jgi:hypothetical protein
VRSREQLEKNIEDFGKGLLGEGVVKGLDRG